MAKQLFTRLFRAEELPALRAAVAALQHDPQVQGPGPEIISEQPWATLAGAEQVLVSLLTHSPTQAFELGGLWAEKLKGGVANEYK